MPRCPNCPTFHDAEYCPECGYRLDDLAVDDACPGPADGTQPPGYLANGTGGEVPSSAAGGGHVEPPATDELFLPASHVTERTDDDGGDDYPAHVTDPYTATVRVDGTTHHIEVESWEFTIEDGEPVAEIVGRVTDTDTDADDTTAARSGEPPASAPPEVYEQWADAPMVPPTTEKSWFVTRDDEEAMAPDDGQCEVCADAPWAVRMWSTECCQHFFYCEECAERMKAKFPDLTPC